MADLLAQMEALGPELDAADSELAGIRPALANGVSTLREATDWIISRGPAGPNNALAGATPYLRLSGLVIGGWLMARSAAPPGRRPAPCGHRRRRTALPDRPQQSDPA